jgi:hypothetical protein
VSESRYSDAQVRAAVEAVSDRERIGEIERAVAVQAPQLQAILGEALATAGWFGETHEAEVLRAATVPDADERLTAVRTLLAEETRLGMMVGVAVGWAIADELREQPEQDKEE